MTELIPTTKEERNDWEVNLGAYLERSYLIEDQLAAGFVLRLIADVERLEEGSRNLDKAYRSLVWQIPISAEIQEANKPYWEEVFRVKDYLRIIDGYLSGREQSDD